MRHTRCLHMSNVFLHLKPVHTQISRNTMDVMRRNCQNQASKCFNHLIQPAIMLKGKNQSTFLPLNRCSLDSPPLDANWNRKSRHTAGLGRKPMERLPTKGRRKGVSKATWKGNIFSAPLAPDKRVSSLDRAGGIKKRINHLFPALSGEFIPPAWRRNILMHRNRNIKEPRGEIHYIFVQIVTIATWEFMGCSKLLLLFQAH